MLFRPAGVMRSPDALNGLIFQDFSRGAARPKPGNRAASPDWCKMEQSVGNAAEAGSLNPSPMLEGRLQCFPKRHPIVSTSSLTKFRAGGLMRMATPMSPLIHSLPALGFGFSASAFVTRTKP